jgi:phosphatidate cytidylyltransferase
MKTRVISGIILVALLIATLLSGGYVTGIVLLLVSLSAYHELSGALGVRQKDEKINILEAAGLVAVVAHYVLMIISHGDLRFFVLVLMLLFFAEATIYVFAFPKYKSAQLIAAVFSMLYAPMMLSFIYLLRTMPNGILLAWLPFVAWICDTCAYFAGSALGKHKLCPQLSPKKTIEGAVGGVLGSALAGVIFGILYVKNVDPGLGMASGVLIFGVITLISGMLSQVGDLIASGIKRDHDIKDYGNLIPGHGGIMDRFDSVIFITPLIFFMALFLLNM